MNYFIDGTQVFTSSGKYYPHQSMTIDFNNWFIAGETLGSATPRTCNEQVDWVYYNAGGIVAPDTVQAQVNAYRSAHTTFTDTVPAKQRQLTQLMTSRYRRRSGPPVPAFGRMCDETARPADVDSGFRRYCAAGAGVERIRSGKTGATMLCYECGYQDSSIGGPHTCSEADLKRAAKRGSAGTARDAQSLHDSWVWLAAFWSTIVMAVIIAAMNVSRLVVLSREHSAVSGLGSPPTAAQIDNLVNADHAVHDLAPFGWLTFVLYVVVLVVWSFVTRPMMRALGVSPTDLRHWSGTAASIGLAVLLVVMFATRQTAVVTNLASLRAAVLRVEAGQIISTVLGIGFAGLLVVRVRALRGRLTELTREREEARLDREGAAAARAAAPTARGPAAP